MIPAGRTAVVLAGGGERVVAWEVGVLAGLADGGFDAGRARVLLGTSAGAAVAARSAVRNPRSAADAITARTRGDGIPAPPSGAAEPFAALTALWRGAGGGREARRLVGRVAVERSPGGEAGFVREVGAGLPDGWPVAVRVVAVEVAAGERVAFGAGSGVPLAVAVAASRAVPLRCPPVTVDGRPHVDGALGSATNADLLLVDVKDGDVDHVVVVSPPAYAVTLEALWGDALEAEVEALAAAGAAVTVLRAGHGDRAAMGPDPVSDAGAALAVTAGREAGHRLALRLAASP